jgi:hypothetical protein
MQPRSKWWAIGLLLAVTACSKSSDVSLKPTTMDCDQGVCIVTIDVENVTENELPLIYEITLFQNYVRDSDRKGLKAVGETSGEVTLLSGERRTIDVTIEVTEEPNGSKVTFFDSRTPKFILEILDT